MRLLILVCASAAMLMGCSYYQVTEPASGRTYFVKGKPDRYDSGAVKFKDGRTGRTVTLTSSEMEKLTKEQYEAARRGAWKEE